MRYIKDTTEIYIDEPTVISLGKFDGIHRGHELLLESLMKKKKEGYATVIFTFHVPPKKEISDKEVKVLTTNDEKMHMFESFGIDYLIEYPFTKAIMLMEPEDFIEMLVSKLHVKCIVAGEDFCFGHNRRGNYKMLNDYAKILSYETIILPKMKEEDRDISSTFVREEIISGHIEHANALLGYSYFVSGTIEHGNQIGRTIGFPTINIIPPSNKLLPEFGVYITKTIIDNISYQSVTNVGLKPTIESKSPVGIETYILDFNQDVYGKKAVIMFQKKIRKEHKFPSIEALTEQMKKDIHTAKYYFSLNN